MIKKLLSIIKEGKVHSIREMAQTLNVSQDLVEQMINDLVRKGYLKEQPQECSRLCGDCSLKQLCLHNEDQSLTSSVWVLNKDN